MSWGLSETRIAEKQARNLENKYGTFSYKAASFSHKITKYPFRAKSLIQNYSKKSKFNTQRHNKISFFVKIMFSEQYDKNWLQIVRHW